MKTTGRAPLIPTIFSLAESDVAEFESSEQGSQPSLRESVDRAMEEYFAHLDGQEAVDVYNMVLSQIEPPLLEQVMRYTRNNQSRASTMLGLNRGTLRKKLKQYKLI
ncbi:MAG: Fis family transcriptional regulator [Halieaceae bacterium]|jgi:Fis family transcriptional regulator